MLRGVQFKNNSSEKKLKPFSHILAGIAHQRLEIDSICSGDCTGISSNSFNVSSTDFAADFGEGLEIKINDKIDFRAIQFDYDPIFLGGEVVNNFRLGIGFVFK